MAVNFIELNILLSQTIDIIDPDGITDTQKVETNLQEITKRLNDFATWYKTRNASCIKQYQDAVKNLLQKQEITSLLTPPTAKHIHNYM